MDSERLGKLVDRQDILDCLVRFSRGMDRVDRELFLSAFHPDAVIAAGDFVGGPAALYDWARPMHEEGQAATGHNLLNHSCEVDGDTAHCETYYLFVGRNRDETNWMAGGRYIDRLERRDRGASPAPALRRHAGPARQRSAVAQPRRPVLPAAAGQPPRPARPDADT
jgi:hypothetical protein